MPNKHLKDGFNTISVGTKPRGSIAKHLKRERFSYDENVGVDVFKIDVKDGEIDLTDSTVTLLYRFFQNDVEYVLKDEVNAVVTDKETIEISRNEKLKNINTTVDVYVYVKFSDNQSIDLFAYSLDFTTSEIDKVSQNQPVPDFDYLDDTKLMKAFETVVQNKINEIESIDLVGGYYNKTQIDAMFESLPEIEEVDLSNYVTKQDLDNKISEIDIPDVSEFLTQDDIVIPDVSEFVTGKQVDDKISEIEIPDTSQFITGTEVDTKISEIQIPDVSNFVTEQDVDTKISQIEIPEPVEVDLSDYVTNETLDNKIQEINIPDVSEFLTQEDLPDTSQFITGTEVDTKISDIVIPDVSSFVTEQDVDNKIAQIEIPDTKDFVQKGDLNPFSISNIEIYRNTHVSPKNLTDEFDNPVLSQYGVTLDIKFDNPDNVPEEIDVNIFQKLNGANSNGAYPYELIPCYSENYVEPDWSEYPPIEPASNYIHKLKRDGETHRCNILYNQFDGTGDVDDSDSALSTYENLKRYQNFKIELLGDTFASVDPLYVNNPFHEAFPSQDENVESTIFDVSVNSAGMKTLDNNLFDENNQMVAPDLGDGYAGVMVGLGLLSFSTDNFVEPSVRIVNENDFWGFIPQSPAKITNLDTGVVTVKNVTGISFLRDNPASDGGGNDTEKLRWLEIYSRGGAGNHTNEHGEEILDFTGTIFETNNTLVEFDLVLQITDDSSAKVFYRTFPVKCVRK